MKNIKDITISIFAIIGFVAILSSFNIQAETQEIHSTPESHIWEMYLSSDSNSTYAYSLNKKTGEVRKYETKYTSVGSNNYFAHYEVSEK